MRYEVSWPFRISEDSEGLYYTMEPARHRLIIVSPHAQLVSLVASTAILHSYNCNAGWGWSSVMLVLTEDTAKCMHWSAINVWILRNTIFLHFTLSSIAAESCCLGFIWINLNTAAPPRPAGPPRDVTDTAGHRDGFLYQPINYELVSCSLRAASRDFFYSIKRLTGGFFKLIERNGSAQLRIPTVALPSLSWLAVPSLRRCRNSYNQQFWILQWRWFETLRTSKMSMIAINWDDL